MLPEPELVASIISQVAIETIMPRFRHLSAMDFHPKEGPHDLVTVADTDAERALSAKLSALIPNSVVVGEEASSQDPELLTQLSGTAPTWIIDPVDGTLNFASGIPMFGVMVALVIDGATVAAWIHCPVSNRTALGVAGQGVTLNGKDVVLAHTSDLKAMNGILSVRDGEPELVGRIASRTGRIGSSFLFRCAAHEYLALLESAAHFSIYHRVMPWDHAAGSFLVEQAGGVVRRIDGTPYSPTDRKNKTPILVATDEPTWNAVYEGIVAPPRQ